MPKDPDNRMEYLTDAQIGEMLRGMELPANIGCHIVASSRNMISELASKQVEGIPLQIATGPLVNLVDYVMPTQELADLALSGKVKLWFHLPFPFTMYMPEKCSYIDKCKNYLVQHVKLLKNMFGIENPAYVMHALYPVKVPEKGSVQVFRTNLEYVFGDVPCTVAVENLVGSVKHSQRYAQPDYIYNNLLPEDKKYSMCYDTEHAFAAGFDWTEALPMKDRITLIHLNGHPYTVTKGSRLDLHSYTSLESSWPEKDFKQFMQAFSDVPMVFERRIPSVILEDWDYCRRITSQA